jgi:hydrogenase maturation protease
MRTLIAGLGNIFAGDDGFGCAVADALDPARLPAGTHVQNFGIRGVHLAFELLETYDLVVMVDAVCRGSAPGTCYVIEHGADPERPDPADTAPLMDAHDMTPDEVLALVPMLGGHVGRVVVVGCEPESIAPSMGLSDTVASSVGRAVELVTEIVDHGVRPGPAAAEAARCGGG